MKINIRNYIVVKNGKVVADVNEKIKNKGKLNKNSRSGRRWIMRRAIKLSLIAGLTLCSAFLLLLRFFQPVTRFHLILFSYLLVLSATISAVLIEFPRRKQRKNNPRGTLAVPVKIIKRDGEVVKGLLLGANGNFLVLRNAFRSKTNSVEEEALVSLEEVKLLELE